jgi:hypothetical protein
LRIDTPRYENDDLANYTNSIIVNRKIYVPLFDIPRDPEALRSWRAAMPGYEVTGYLLSKEELDMRYTDAIHCRVRAIWDQRMLHMTHKRIRSSAPSESGFHVAARIRDYSNLGLLEDQLRLAWRIAGTRSWNEIPLKRAAPPHAFGATIPEVEAGQTVEYYLSAASRSGRKESLPRTAPKGYYAFKVEENASR